VAISSHDVETLKTRLGVEWPARSYPIEREMVRRFTRAVGDTNPAWKEGEVAPPIFMLAVGGEFVDDVLALAPFQTLLMASTDLDFFSPIRPGDVITVVFKLSRLLERKGTMGQMVFMTFDSEYKNQHQVATAHCRQMIIGY
jgi:acyl dehydratase